MTFVTKLTVLSASVFAAVLVAGPALAKTKKKDVNRCPAIETASCALGARVSLASDAMRVADMASDQAALQELERIAAADKTYFDAATRKTYKPKQFLVRPTRESCGGVKYDFSPETTLQPGEAVYFSVPERLRSRSVVAALLGHRQDPSYGNNSSIGTGWDESPGNTAIQMHDKTLPADKAMRGYQAPWGESAVAERRGQGSKFAEIKSYPELETLEGFRAHGHKGSIEGDVSHAPIFADAFRALSTGKDPVLLSSVAVKFDPFDRTKVDPAKISTKEFVFNAGAVFENYATGAETVKPGGFDPGGSYPGALSVGGTPSGTLPAGWRQDASGIHIPVPAGYKLVALDAIAGDQHSDGSSGGAKLNMSYKRKSGVVMPYMSRENVGKHDLMVGYPEKECDYVSEAGDEIVISSDGDTAHISGIRMHLEKVR